MQKGKEKGKKLPKVIDDIHLDEVEDGKVRRPPSKRKSSPTLLSHFDGSKQIKPPSPTDKHSKSCGKGPIKNSRKIRGRSQSSNSVKSSTSASKSVQTTYKYNSPLVHAHLLSGSSTPLFINTLRPFPCLKVQCLTSTCECLLSKPPRYR